MSVLLIVILDGVVEDIVVHFPIISLVKVLNEEKLLLKQLMYMQDVVINFKTVPKTKNIYFSNVYRE